MAKLMDFVVDLGINFHRDNLHLQAPVIFLNFF